MQRTRTKLYFTVMLICLTFSAPLLAGEKGKGNEKENTTSLLPGVMWRDPGDVASLNLLYGAGGKQSAPDPNGRFTFVKEDSQGTSPKFDVTDDQGVQWKVKLGQEPQSETAATRLLWAAGYFVDEDYSGEPQSDEYAKVAPWREIRLSGRHGPWSAPGTQV